MTTLPSTRRSVSPRTATGVALLLGIATSFAQTVLPTGASPLANSAGPWCAIAAGCALAAGRTRRRAVLTAVAALVALVVGYYGTSAVRGFPVGSRAVVFWLLCAAVAGPVLGLAAAVLREDRSRLAGPAAAVLSGLLVGEGLFGLLTVRATTSTGYWVTEVVLGIALLAGLSAAVLRDTAARASALVGTVVLAAVLVVGMRADLLDLLPV